MNVFRMTNIRDDTYWRYAHVSTNIHHLFVFGNLTAVVIVKLIGFQLVKPKMNVFVWSGSQVLWPSLTAVV